MTKGKWIALLAAVAVLAVLATQLDWTLDELSTRPSEEEDRDTESLVARELGAAYFEEERYEEARTTLRSVLDSRSANAQDLVNAACVELSAPEGDEVQAKKYLEEALRVDSELPAIHYCLGVLAGRQGDEGVAPAVDHFSRAAELAPRDAPTLLSLASALQNAERLDEAIEAYQRVLDLGFEYAGSYYFVTLYKLGMALRRNRDDRAMEYLSEHRRRADEGLETPSTRALELGNLAKVRVPRPRADAGQAAEAPLPVSWAQADTVGESLGAIRGVRAADVDGDRRRDLVLWTADAAHAVLRRPGAEGEQHTIASGSFADAWVADLHQHREELRKSVLLRAESGELSLWIPAADGGFAASTLPFAGSARDAHFVDQDHDGDLDLLVATADGLVLLRHDTAPTTDGEEGTPPSLGPVEWTDVTADSGMPSGSFDWLAIEDFDADQDIDFLAGGTGGPQIVSNLRKGQFEVLAQEACGLLSSLSAPPVLEDLDRDGFVDLWYGSAGAFLRNEGDGTFQTVGDVTAPTAQWVAGDVDLDGLVDAIGVEDGALVLQRGPLAAGGGASETLAAKATVPLPVLTDLDGDGDLDLLGAASAGVTEWRCDAAEERTPFRLVLQGRKDNRDSVGAIVEVRAGASYRRVLSREQGHTYGCGPAGKVDVVRVTWPNGVVQYATLPDSAEELVLLQKEGLVGSCPFLYTFDGERWHFITDILGITPLGLPMEEGVYVPPDHDEFVRIEGDLLAPVDGEYHLQVTEELREVTYLDHVRLLVIDHDEDVVIHPEERFCFPPFPEHHIHAMQDVLPIESAVDGDGREWAEELAAVDLVHAAPFEHAPSQFLGLATPHTLEFTLPERVRDAERVRLLLTGWFYWTDASVNVAAGHHDQYEFVPPLLTVPDGNGGWRDTGPPIGFPAGKTKTMVIDVTDRLNRDDLRFRLFSTMRLYWDAVEVAVDAGEAPFETRELAPTMARLYERGFSAPMPRYGDDQPEQFDFERLRPAPWNQHHGMLTRFGDVRPLLSDIDDRFAVFGAGDAVELRFDAREIPPLAPGKARTFLLFADGWAKDGDPNTMHGGTVEPLPFHGMSGYPYGPDETYPQDELHQRTLREWNTRPGRQLIPSLAPANTTAAEVSALEAEVAGG